MKCALLLLFTITFNYSNCLQVKQKYAYKGVTNPDLNLGQTSGPNLGFDVRLEYGKFEAKFKELILKCMPKDLKMFVRLYKTQDSSADVPLFVLIKGESGSGKTVTAEAIAQELSSPFIKITALNVFCDSYLDTPLRILKYAQEFAKENKALIIIEDIEVFYQLGTHFANFLDLCKDENILILANTCEKIIPKWLERRSEIIFMESTVSDDNREEFVEFQMQPCNCDQYLLKKWAHRVKNFKKYEIEVFGRNACSAAYWSRESRKVEEKDLQEGYKSVIEMRKEYAHS